MKLIRIENVSGHAIPEHAEACPKKENEDCCPLDIIPTFDGEEYFFEEGEIKCMSEVAAKHLRKNHRDWFELVGPALDMQALIGMATKDPKNLTKMFEAKPGQKVTISLKPIRQEAVGENLLAGDMAKETLGPPDPGARVPVTEV